MKLYDATKPPFRVFGIPNFEEHGRLERLPRAVREAVPSLMELGCHAVGARIGFRTDAEEFTVRVTLGALTVDVGMSLYACQSVAVTVGSHTDARFLGLVRAKDYETLTVERTFTKEADCEDVMLWLPRNETTVGVWVELPEGASLTAPTPYTYGKALFYGSSITEGGCSSLPTNNYVGLLSRHLDMDFYNMGFSGRAKGETALAEYLKTLDMSIFVYDYDHNAPDVEHLKATHERFFSIIREAHPTMPVLMLTRPNFDETPDADARRAVVRETFERALSRGDTNVYFIDGERFFGDTDRTLCTMDGTHPNDLGFYRMAAVIEPVLREILSRGV